MLIVMIFICILAASELYDFDDDKVHLIFSPHFFFVFFQPSEDILFEFFFLRSICDLFLRHC